MVKVVTFDLGNVIFKVDFTPFIFSLSHLFGIPSEQANSFLTQHQASLDLGITNLIDEIQTHFHLPSDQLSVPVSSVLLDSWYQSVITEPLTLRFLQELLDDKVKIYFVSNIGNEHSKTVEEIFSKELKGDYINFFSSYLGARKPQWLYFKTLLDMHPETHNCLYVDDLDANLNVGIKFGFRGYKFELNKSIDLKKDLEIIKSLI